jgi:hypothetical protein
MPSVKFRIKTGSRTESSLLESILSEIRGSLEKRRLWIVGKMGQYPRPIPGCDQQFNYLLAERDGIFAELVRLDEIASAVPTRRDPVELIDAFLGSSTCLDAKAKQAIRSRLKGT